MKYRETLTADAKQVFEFLLKRLNYKNSNNLSLTGFDNNEVVVTERPMSKSINLSTRRIRRSFDELSDQGLIEKRIYNHRTAIRIIAKDINLES